MATGDLSKVGLLSVRLRGENQLGSHPCSCCLDRWPVQFLLRLLPMAGGDAPGSDPTDAPRPLGGHRLLSANVEGVPYSVRIYDTAASPSDVIGIYEGGMSARGWQSTYGAPNDGHFRSGFSKAGVDLYV